MRSHLSRFIILLLWVTISLQPNLAHAQDLTQPNVEITGIQTDGYPEIEFTVYGQNLGINLADMPLIVREDKTERSPQSSSLGTVGIQTALVLDASNNIRLAGNTGQLRYKEFANAAETFLQRGVLAADTDWLGAFTTGPSDDQFRTIGVWSRDHGGLRNQIFVYIPQDNTPKTPLFDLIEYTLDQFQDSPAPTNLQRSMIVFSDGFDATSDLDSKDVIRRAVDENIRIYTVMVGPSAVDRRSNLERISKLTDGKFVFLDSIAALTPIWDELGQQRYQRIVKYRTNIPQPQSLTIEAQIPGRTPLVRTEPFPATGARPVEIRITDPMPETLIQRDAEAFDSDLANVEPRFLHIKLQFIWPDGLARTLRRVEYTINDETQIQEQGPFDEFHYLIADLPSGDYTLRVAAVDEAGLTSQAAPVPIEISVNIPPVPLPTAVPTLAPTAIPTLVPTAVPVPPAVVVEPAPSSLSLFSLLRIPLALLALFFIYRWWRKRKEDETESSIFFDTDGIGQGAEFSSFTEYPSFDQGGGLNTAMAFSGNGSPSAGLDVDATVIPGPPNFDAKPVAHLVCLTHGNHLPDRIPLQPHGKIRIGRSAQTCDIVLDDMRISRSHAYIMEKEDGFHILDDISTGGTFVNKRPLGVSGDRILQDGDVINFHEVSYRFDVEKDQEMVQSHEPMYQQNNVRTSNGNGSHGNNSGNNNSNGNSSNGNHHNMSGSMSGGMSIGEESATQPVAHVAGSSQRGAPNMSAEDDGQTEYPSIYDDSVGFNPNGVTS